MAKGWTKEELIRDLTESGGLKAGDKIIVHSSMQEVGRVAEGTKMIVQAMKEVITPAGMIMMPALSDVTDDCRFYIAKSPSRVGLITELFRLSEGVKRSKHPTHSATAWGTGIDELLAGHENTTAMGIGNPFTKAAQAGADMIMIGCTLTTCTLVHAAEAIHRTPYLGKVAYGDFDKELTLIDYDGTEIKFPAVDLPGDGAGFGPVQEVLEQRGLITHWKLGDAKCLKFNALECLNIAVELVKNDYTALLCNNPRCGVCPKSKELIAQAAAKGEA